MSQNNLHLLRFRPFRRFFHFCSGAIPDILKFPECSTEQIKYSCIGATVFFTAVLASISGGYALYKVFGEQRLPIPLIFRDDFVSIPLSIAFGIFWGLMIFNLDRYIVQSIRKEDEWHKQLLNALPRICLAILLSLVITKPLELKIFEREIKSQLDKENEQIQKDEESRQEKSTIANDIKSLEDKNKTLNDEIKNKEAQKDSAVLTVQQELDGTGGSTEEGPGPIYTKKLKDADDIKTELENLRKKNNDLISTNNQKIADLNNQKTDRVKTVVESQKKADGILGSLMALGKLTDDNTTAYWIDLGIIALFISLETAPVFVKLFSKRGTYDAILERLEEEVFIKERENIKYLENNSENELSHKIQMSNESRRVTLENFQNSIQQAQGSEEFMKAQADIHSRIVDKMIKRLSTNLDKYFSEGGFDPYLQNETQQTRIHTENQIKKEIKKHYDIRKRISNFVSDAKKKLSDLVSWRKNK